MLKFRKTKQSAASPIKTPAATPSASPTTTPINAPASSWKDSVVSDTKSITSFGYKWVGITLLAFGLWAVVFPISSAVVATGTVVASGQNQTLQHPTGGVILNITAKDGSLIEKGQLIVEIEPAAQRAQLTQLLARQSLLLAQEERLNSGKNGFNSQSLISKINYSTTTINQQENSIKTVGLTDAVFEQQEIEFNASQNKFNSQISALQNQLSQQGQDYDGLQVQINQQILKTDVIKKQHKKLQPLAVAGYVANAKLWDIELRLADSNSLLASQAARAGSLQASMNEIRDRILTLNSEKKENDAKERSAVLSELIAVNEQIESAKTSLSYSQMKAPVSGTLINMTANTIGGVVAAGAVIGEIVPANQPLLVEALIAPLDIGEVKLGQTVEIMVTAFNRRINEPLDGKVIYIAADSFTEETTGQSFFKVHVALPNIPKSTPNMSPGMMAEVYVNTGARTFISYVTTPVVESLRKAFNEK